MAAKTVPTTVSDGTDSPGVPPPFAAFGKVHQQSSLLPSLPPGFVGHARICVFSRADAPPQLSLPRRARNRSFDGWRYYSQEERAAACSAPAWERMHRTRFVSHSPSVFLKRVVSDRGARDACYFGRCGWRWWWPKCVGAGLSPSLNDWVPLERCAYVEAIRRPGFASSFVCCRFFF